MTVPKATITIGIIVSFMFHSFSILEQSRGTYPSFHILSVLLCGQPGQQSPQFCKFSFLLLIIIRSGLLAENRGSVCISKSLWSLCVSFSRTDDGLCIYHWFVWSNFNFLQISQWITLPTQSCLVFSSFCANYYFDSHSLSLKFEWQQISSSLADPNNVVVWMVFTCLVL